MSVGWNPISILDVGSVDRYRQQVAVCIDNHLSFPSIDLFAAIKATFASS